MDVDVDMDIVVQTESSPSAENGSCMDACMQYMHVILVVLWQSIA